MSRIAGEFCTWLRDLPGEDTKVFIFSPHMQLVTNMRYDHPVTTTTITMVTIVEVNHMGEEHLRALFDTAQSANPGTTKLAEGLR